jgi:hypothetical protein
MSRRIILFSLDSRCNIHFLSFRSYIVRVNPLLLAVAVTACASSANPPPRPAGSDGTISVSAPTGRGAISTNTAPIPGVVTIAAPIGKIWLALPAVYDSLAIPRTTFDPPSHTIGNVGMQLRRQLGNVRLSRYLDCGSPQSRPSADFYDVNLSVVTQLQAEQSGDTRLTTTVDAMAKPVAFGGEYVRCASTGGIEAKLRSLLDAELKK